MNKTNEELCSETLHIHFLVENDHLVITKPVVSTKSGPKQDMPVCSENIISFPT